MWRLVALAFVACSTPPARAPEPPRRAGSTPPPASPPPVAPVPTVHTAYEPVESPHAGVIVTLAATPDGGAVLSADELGGVRLWPALDGTREPRIVQMPVAKQLALGRRPGGYTAVGLDEAGGLYIAKLDEGGSQLAHTTLPGEPPVLGVAPVGAKLLVWRSDQTFALLDEAGAVTEQLATEPRQRLVSVAAAGTRAIVLLDRDGTKRQARWLSLAPRLAWGAWIDLEQELLGTVDLALAPGGQHLAATLRTDRTTTAIVFELAKGKAVASGTFNSENADVGFVDDVRVAIGGFQGLAWIDLSAPSQKLAPISASSPGLRTQPVLGTGGGRAITAMNGELAISTPSQTQYLGYDSVAPRIAERAADGKLIVGVGDRLLLLDRQLRVESTPFSGINGTIAEVRWIGDADWLLESTSPNEATMQVALVGPAASTVLRKGLKEAQVVSYEPSTQLVTLSFGTTSEVARLDRKKRTLERVAIVGKPSPYEQVLFVPTAPALARGTKLVQVTMRERSTVKWLHDPAALDKPAATAVVEGPFAGADSAGNVYMWRNTSQAGLELAVYADGKLVRTLPNHGAVALWPEPSGRRYIEVAPSSVALHDADGKQLWLQQLATSQEALWLADGAIALTSAGGVARLDPATGAVTAARCGWRFGLASKPHPPTPRVEPLCAQLRR